MFTLGTVWIGNYKVWITTPVSTVSPLSSEAGDLPYYEVMVSKRMLGWPPGYYSYVNPIKEIFKWDMTDRNPLARPKDKQRLTLDEEEFRVEQSSYNDRKEIGMPLTKLARVHVRELLARLEAMPIQSPSKLFKEEDGDIVI